MGAPEVPEELRVLSGGVSESVVVVAIGRVVVPIGPVVGKLG